MMPFCGTVAASLPLHAALARRAPETSMAEVTAAWPRVQPEAFAEAALTERRAYGRSSRAVCGKQAR